MVKNLDGLKHLMSKLIAQATKENEEGPHTFKVRVNGNWEPIDNDVKESMMALFSGSSMMLSDLFVIFNGEYTIIELRSYDVRHILSYVKSLEGKIGDIKTNDFAIKSLNTAISLLDDFNNNFGEGKWNKTEEITKLDEAIKTLKN
jgi:hypothetical protein